MYLLDGSYYVDWKPKWLGLRNRSAAVVQYGRAGPPFAVFEGWVSTDLNRQCSALRKLSLVDFLRFRFLQREVVFGLAFG
jgi:hypothetical protein